MMLFFFFFTLLLSTFGALPLLFATKDSYNVLLISNVYILVVNISYFFPLIWLLSSLLLAFQNLFCLFRMWTPQWPRTGFRVSRGWFWKRKKRLGQLTAAGSSFSCPANKTSLLLLLLQFIVAMNYNPQPFIYAWAFLHFAFTPCVSLFHAFIPTPVFIAVEETIRTHLNEHVPALPLIWDMNRKGGNAEPALQLFPNIITHVTFTHVPIKPGCWKKSHKVKVKQMFSNVVEGLLTTVKSMCDKCLWKMIQYVTIITKWNMLLWHVNCIVYLTVRLT